MCGATRADVRLTMARHHGTAGGALIGRLVVLAALILALGFGGFFIMRSFVPALAPLAPFIGVLLTVGLLRDRAMQRKIVAVGRGAIGEVTVGTALGHLPSGWRGFHDVQLEGENIDHVVVSNRGVFSVEVKNYSGHVAVNGGDIFRNGHRQPKILPQVRRQRAKLMHLVGVDVQPILVFVGIDVGDHRVGRVIVTSTDRLTPTLLGHTEQKLTLQEGYRIFAVLEALTA
jgi:hypothetical protein